MTRQVGIDQEDLCLNGDTATDSSDPDYDFLKLNDGWVKQIATGGHVVDHASAGMSLDVFYKALRSLPSSAFSFLPRRIRPAIPILSISPERARRISCRTSCVSPGRVL